MFRLNPLNKNLTQTDSIRSLGVNSRRTSWRGSCRIPRAGCSPRRRMSIPSIPRVGSTSIPEGHRYWASWQVFLGNVTVAGRHLLGLFVFVLFRKVVECKSIQLMNRGCPRGTTVFTRFWLGNQLYPCHDASNSQLRTPMQNPQRPIPIWGPKTVDHGHRGV